MRCPRRDSGFTILEWFGNKPRNHDSQLQVINAVSRKATSLTLTGFGSDESSVSTICLLSWSFHIRISPPFLSVLSLPLVLLVVSSQVLGSPFWPFLSQIELVHRVLRPRCRFNFGGRRRELAMAHVQRLHFVRLIQNLVPVHHK
jgi:hypothetical protein